MSKQPVGIIGSACRFPGETNSPSKLWKLLETPTDVVSEFSPERLNLKTFYHEKGDYHGSTNVQNKGYLLTEDIRRFDASFFHISPAEAECLDPQQRLLLETVYESLESAGCPLSQIQGSLTSVYAGLMNADYADISGRDIETIPLHHGTGTHRSILSNRISYFLDAKGASMTIDTACSSSLVALHQAVQSLRAGESDMAIVAGANLILDPIMHVAESKLGMLSPDSRSRMWDAKANGYARGEGFAAIVLKPLSRAIDDGNDVECVIRGSAVNSDGRTAGITVPNASAQTALIRQAYRDAGLDPVADRCQFFEAHGTGTSAGDPVEARAIREAFFPETQDNSAIAPPAGRLRVGSIKTVVGHLEGAAGVAGILKASLAIQNGIIPPNLHFTELNPRIAPFYDRLEVPTKATPWPEMAPGQPRRVSVNSFGFGGTNAHVILESFNPEGSSKQEPNSPIIKKTLASSGNVEEDEPFVGPLLFSANSRDSLIRNVQAHATHIRDNNNNISLSDLTWTLQARRTQFSHSRAFFSGATRSKLLSYMDTFVESSSSPSASPPSSSSSSAPALTSTTPAILAIFTGQGAQWPTMGSRLYHSSPLFRSTIDSLEESLSTCPDPPSWSLSEEMLASQETSRVSEASVSQPLCAAVQIGLVDLLEASGLLDCLKGVVGHSSGEIGACYAAGILSGRDAVRVAYYRGFHAEKLKKGNPDFKRGAMMAVGMSFEKATELCESSPDFKGKVVVAAANAPASVTVSGDEESVMRMKEVLDADKVFARRLVNVDVAYHSHHMVPCADGYRESLRACDIQVRRPRKGCVWVSSVLGDVVFHDDEEEWDDDDDEALAALKDQYWVDNLVSPVLFEPAVECSLWRAGPFDIATEIGPHPALKGPATQILKASLGHSLPYFSIMRRGDDDVEAFSGGLGYLWEHFGTAASVDWDGYRRAFVDEDGASVSPPKLVKGLPSYCWDHSRVHWRESRLSHKLRLDYRPVHEMLGRRAPDDSPELLRWRNILRASEIPWVRDHVFQGQILLPGAAYMAAIMEAANVLAQGKAITMMELFDFKIPKACVLQENKSTELSTSLRILNKADNFFSAEFFFSIAPSDDAASILEKTCTGRVEIHLDDKPNHHQQQPLPPLPSRPHLKPVDLEKFYAVLKELGIDYQNAFRMQSAQRTMGYASTEGTWGQLGNSYLLHPAVLDVGLQSVLAAFASPTTGQMWTMYLPTAIRRATIYPSSLPARGSDDISAQVAAQVTTSTAKGLAGDVQILFGSQVGVQMEGIELQATGDSSDRTLFSSLKWDVDISTGVADDVVLEIQPDAVRDDELSEATGRISLYYYRQMLDDISPREMKKLAWHMQMFWQSAEHWVEETREGRHATLKKEWLNDTRQDMVEQADKFRDSIDIQIMWALGERLPEICRAQVQPLEIMMENNMLSRFYAEAYGLPGRNDHIARGLGQISHRYPRANILEIGAGVGGTTRKVLREMGNSFNHYTFTDISSGFFEKGAENFAQHRHKMTFKVCDIEKDPIDQGFTEHGYDVIVAANVLHATTHMEDTMRHVRKLLQPGGFLVLMEITGDMARLGFIMGPLPGWWYGPQIGDEGRQYHPGLSAVEWDDLLQRTGFSGVDYIETDNNEDPHKHYVSTLVTQAVDEQVNVLRQPLAHLSSVPPLAHRVVILGGETLPVSRLSRDLKKKLSGWRGTSVDTVASLEQFSSSINTKENEKISVISLVELDKPLFAKGTEMTAPRLAKLQALLDACDSILWTTAGSRNGGSPESNMFVGLARALRTERSDINLQLLDVGDRATDSNADTLVDCFLRLVLSKQSEYADKLMLWTNEAEIALDEQQRLLIPRLVPDVARNERYNACRRAITKHVTLEEEQVQVDIDGGVVTILGSDRRLIPAPKSHETRLAVDLSVAMIEPQQECFLSYGTSSSSGKKAFVVSNINQSSIICASENVFEANLDSQYADAPSAVLEALAGQLIARNVATGLPRKGAVLIYEPPSDEFASIMESSSAWKSRKVYFATARTDKAVPESWISIHPHVLSSSLRKSLVGDIAAVVDFSSATGSSRDIRPLVASNCLVRRFEPSMLLETNQDEMRNALADALQALHRSVDGETCAMLAPTAGLPIETLAGIHPSAVSYPAVIDWRQQKDEMLTVQVKPLTPDGIFNSEKTHLLVGLNGDLGQSICAYMIRNGARHVAIVSRSGNVDGEWLETMKRDHRGVDVRLYQMDVSNQQDVVSTIDKIKTEMPPIAGVANGALVLHDKMLLSMDVDSLNDTLRPKVDGTRHLNDLFQDPELDYFVCFSSLATVGNNHGQGNYHAANMFMTSLVKSRRAEGLAGSVIHVGVVVDAGYVARQDSKLIDQLAKKGFMPCSETDAHSLFAEGVLASRADSQLDSDITMGLEPFVDNAGEPGLRPPWYTDARLSHFIVQPEDLGDAKKQKTTDGDGLSTKERLEGVQTPEEINALLQEAFAAKLESTMQLDAGAVSGNAHMPLLDLGFDSLLAVETRTWFLKEIGVDVPVLRFLDGATVLEICDEASAKFLVLRAEQGEPGKKQEQQQQEERNSESVNHLTTASASSKQDHHVAQSSSSSVHDSSESGQPTLSTTGSSSTADMTQSIMSNRPQTAQTRLQTPEIPEKEPEKEQEPEKKAQEHVETLLKSSGITTLKQKTVSTVRDEKMSYAQSRLWFLDQHLDDATTCNIVVEYLVRGPIDVTRFRSALDKVVAHHPSLRTCFYTDDETGEPRQGLLRKPAACTSMKYVHAKSRHDIQAEIDALRHRQWDLVNGESFSSTLISTEDVDVHHLIFGYHHIVIDGVSWFIFLKDLQRALDSKPLSRQPKLSMEASAEQREAIESGSADEAISFWENIYKEKLPEVTPLLPFASVRRRKHLRRYDSHVVERDMGSGLVAKIKEASKALHVTPNHFYLAAMQVLFSRLLQVEDLCIGVTDASRTDDAIANTTGFFLNMLPLRFQVGSHDSFHDVVRRTFKHVIQARSNGHIPIDIILDRLNVPRDGSVSPLFQLTFNYRVGSMAEVDLSRQLHLSVQSIRDAQSPFDMGFGVYETEGSSCVLQVVAQSCLYDKDAADLVATAYLNLLGRLAADTRQSLAAHAPLWDDELGVQEGISVGTGSRQSWDDAWPGETISSAIAAVIEKMGDKGTTAIVDHDGEQVTYGQLKSSIISIASAIMLAEQLPHQNSNNSGSGSRIAVLCQPSAHLVASMLAIIRLGHVYVPLDINLPSARHSAMLHDSDPSIVICHESTLESAESLVASLPGDSSQIKILNISSLLTTTSSPSSFSIPPFPSPTAPAFLLYTSGSTGKPKGIQLPQGGLANHIALKTHLFGLSTCRHSSSSSSSFSDPEVILQQSSFGFDMSLTQTFLALCNGGTLVIASSSRHRNDPVELGRLMRDWGVTVTVATPSEYGLLLRFGGLDDDGAKGDEIKWKHAAMGGEVVGGGLLGEFERVLGKGKGKDKDICLTNCYGPTETTLAVTFEMGMKKAEEMAAGGDSVVGKVLPNYSVYIVDEEEEGEGKAKAVPIGFPGEICVGGAGVALGYWNLPELSADKFVENPWASEEDRAKGWGRMYRTGDRGRFRKSDGKLIFMGRCGNKDNMTKIRGLRVDLDDVANTVMGEMGDIVSDAVVTVRGGGEEGDNGLEDRRFLVAHVTVRAGREVDAGELQRRAHKLPLPSYMRPSLVVAIEAMPKTPNGKVDRRAIENLDLPSIEPPGQSSTGLGDKLGIEQGELSLLWEQVLGASMMMPRAELSPDSDFFMVGGSSLLLVQLQGAIKETLGLSIPVAELYQASTLGRMSSHINQEKGQLANMDKIDWEKETEFHANIPAVPYGTATKRESDREILLTGAHTFLGAEILANLIADKTVKRIHCIAMPRNTNKNLPSSSKVRYYPGSLRSPMLGLSPDDVSHLQARIDVILHAASMGHCLNNYSSVRTPNLDSLRFLITHLSLPRRVPLHFISSSRVTLLSGNDQLPPLSVRSHPPPTDGTEGFTASKWAGECLLENVANSIAFAPNNDSSESPSSSSPPLFTIHRPCAVIGPNAPTEDALNALLRFAVSQDAVPRFGANLTGFLDFAPVSQVAGNITRVALLHHPTAVVVENNNKEEAEAIVNMSSPSSSTPVAIAHHSSGIPTPMAHFRARMETLYGRDFGELPMAEWIDGAVKGGMDPLISTYLGALVERDDTMRFPFLGAREEQAGGRKD